MSVVLVGGHERMEKIYKNTGKDYGCRTKVFTKLEKNLHRKIGDPDYILIFTDVVSHRLTDIALKVSKKKKIPKMRVHNSSLNTLKLALEEITS
ncbi:DUF2325 domain-containing protein [Clostridiisalibacter paucivorans]|uniref:DUF2325 domain-containing protein n=1 Tax=Clostridiisalibacter paucivorans TaxID=408753 RepID=UPI00047EE5BB|nr:DUF2325 domain-containing protein [Clostridiisalibacter paucivorans]